MARFFLGLVILASCCVAGPFVWAASQDTSIHMQVGVDTNPPTIPVLTSAIPVSDDQIDLEWDPSTDDFALSGYTIERDGLHLATTTLTTYSDTGLIASTTYSYVVRAFDSSGNISSSSNALATTTLSTPVIPPATTTVTDTPARSNASGKMSLQGDVVIITTATSAHLWWQTNRPSRYILRWGRTTSYELGAIATDRYEEQHEAFLTDLALNTTYYYELVAFNPAAPIAQVLKSGTFKTKPAVVATVPPNVSRLTATILGEDVFLSWQNPIPPEDYTVRVVRSHLGYPLDPYDGMVIAQGKMEGWQDTSALRAYGTQFYTVFVIDIEGNVSSGALVFAQVPANDIKVATTSPIFKPIVIPPDLTMPLLPPRQIVVSQNGTPLSFENEVLTLDPSQPITITIPVAALPAHLKSIIVTLTDPTDSRNTYRFLLRQNPAGDAYETTLAPISVQGTSLLLIEVFDLEAQMVGRYGRQVNFVLSVTEPPVVFPDVFFRYWLWGVGFLLLLAVLGYGIRRHYRNAE